MKISEKLSEIKQLESQLMRQYALRESIIQQEFRDVILNATNVKTIELEKRQKKFLTAKVEKVKSINKKIDDLKAQLIEDKNNVNRKNVEIGVDKMLIKMKYYRVELSKLMKLAKQDMWSRAINIDVDVYEMLGIADRIKDLETKKTKLDSQIQQLNWSTEL